LRKGREAVVQFSDWCSTADVAVGSHALRVLSGDPARLDTGVTATAAVVPTHYAAEEHISRVLARLGKPTAAKFISDKLPTTKSIRSGDLGEIFATEYIVGQTTYSVPIKRLRWKDHRNMAMRGDDVIGIAQDQTSGRLQFLKAEAKSRAALSARVMAEARAALDKDGGLPSAHALSFISECLMVMGDASLADAIDDAQLKLGIPLQSVRHLLFTFSGNAPNSHLAKSLQSYTGPIPQFGVGLQVAKHATFIEDIYDRVIANANNN
jgi:uncharacterized protein DUF1837